VDGNDISTRSASTEQVIIGALVDGVTARVHSVPAQDVGG